MHTRHDIDRRLVDLGRASRETRGNGNGSLDGVQGKNSGLSDD